MHRQPKFMRLAATARLCLLWAVCTFAAMSGSAQADDVDALLPTLKTVDNELIPGTLSELSAGSVAVTLRGQTRTYPRRDVVVWRRPPDEDPAGPPANGTISVHLASGDRLYGTLDDLNDTQLSLRLPTVPKARSILKVP